MRVGLGYEIGVVDVRAGGDTHYHSPRKHHQVCQDLGQSQQPHVLLSLLSLPLIPTHPFLSFRFTDSLSLAHSLTWITPMNSHNTHMHRSIDHHPPTASTPSVSRPNHSLTDAIIVSFSFSFSLTLFCHLTITRLPLIQIHCLFYLLSYLPLNFL